jgi:hypothetical protein
MAKEWEVSNQKELFTFELLIQELNDMVQMKNTPLSTFPNFHGLTSEDTNTFLFEFDVLCWTYDYSFDSQNIKLFPSTLKEVVLHWFMGIGGNNIQTWE